MFVYDPNSPEGKRGFVVMTLEDLDKLRDQAFKSGIAHGGDMGVGPDQALLERVNLWPLLQKISWAPTYAAAAVLNHLRNGPDVKTAQRFYQELTRMAETVTTRPLPVDACEYTNAVAARSLLSELAGLLTAQEMVTLQS